MPFPTAELFRCLRAPLAWLALSAISATAQAHEGHDHGGPQPTVSARSSPRLAARSETSELVGILNQGALRVVVSAALADGHGIQARFVND